MRVVDVMRNLVKRVYAEPMGIARRGPGPGERIAPVHRPEAIRQFENQWVGIREGQVIAHAATSRELATELKKLGSEGEDAVMQFVRPPVAGYVIGVG